MTSQLFTLNDDECKRIISVIERDFNLRQKEYKRLEQLTKIIHQEHERIEYLAGSKEFNRERCIRCFKQFKFFFNPKQLCFECKYFVCQHCATYNKQMKIWACQTCLKLKELESFKFDWFYLQTGMKYKRCGSSKVVRELNKYKRKLSKINEFDEDELKYETIVNTKASGTMLSYIVHDRNMKGELNQYSKRLVLLVDNLQSDLSESDMDNNPLSMGSKYKESLKVHQQQIATEINRVRVALIGPLRRSCTKLNISYESDLQNLLIQQTEKVLQTNLQEFQKSLTTPNAARNFDQNLAQAIFDKCTRKEISQNLPQILDSSSTNSLVSSKALQSSTPSLSNSSLVSSKARQSSTPSLTNPSLFQLTRSITLPETLTSSSEMKSHNNSFQKISLFRASAVDEEDTEDEEGQLTPTETNRLYSSSIDDEISNHSLPDTNFQGINSSNESVDEWKKIKYTLVDTRIIPSDDEEEEEKHSTWL